MCTDLIQPLNLSQFCPDVTVHGPCPSGVNSLKDEAMWNGLGSFKEAEDEHFLLLMIVSNEYLLSHLLSPYSC